MRYIFIIPVLFVLSACSINENAGQKEYILLQAQDYNGLITLYRNKLKLSDNKKDRFKLSEYYYKIEDYESSIFYLKPILTDDNAKVLFIKNVLSSHQSVDLAPYFNELIKNRNMDGEIWNLYGVYLTKINKLQEAESAFLKARDLFYNELDVSNNLAMVYIMRYDFSNAKNILYNLYRRGLKNDKSVANLVYAAVCDNDERLSREIIKNEYPDANAEKFIEQIKMKSSDTAYKQTKYGLYKNNNMKRIKKVSVEKNDKELKIKLSSDYALNYDVNFSNSGLVTIDLFNTTIMEHEKKLLSDIMNSNDILFCITENKQSTVLTLSSNRRVKIDKNNTNKNNVLISIQGEA
ncbi:hypothetical protein ABGK91_001747 [Escherichia albertii]